MGYQIQYGQTTIKTIIPDRRKRRLSAKRLGVSVCLILFFAAIYFVGGEDVLDFLLPGDGAHTRASISKMINDLQEGQALPDAFEAFCLEIINGSEIP